MKYKFHTDRHCGISISLVMAEELRPVAPNFPHYDIWSEKWNKNLSIERELEYKYDSRVEMNTKVTLRRKMRYKIDMRARCITNVILEEYKCDIRDMEYKYR